MPTATLTSIVTAAQRHQLDDQGFFITDVLFDEPTLKTIRADFEKMWGEDIADAKKSGDKLAIDWATLRPHMAQLDYRSEACRAFCHHPVFAQLSAELIGPDADLTWNQAIVKAPMPAGTVGSPTAWDNVFAWHQDLWYAVNGAYIKDCDETLLRAPDNSITCWVAITRTIVDNGTLWVLPGRHKEGLIHHNWHVERKEWQAQVDPSFKIPAVLRPGQMLVFRKYLPHSSGTNISQEVRMAYQISYSVPGINKVPTKNITPLIRAGQIV